MVGGRIYPIRTDYRAGIAYSMAASDGSLTPQRLLDIWFPGPAPSDFAAAQEAVNAFYRRTEDKPDSGKDGPMPYSYLADAGAIFAAFQRAYGIDLSAATMHWWRFMALLEALVTHSFEDRVQYRITEPSKIKDKAQREHYYQMRRLYQLDEHGQPAAKQAPMTLEEYNNWMLQHALQRKER
nr:MAG TPA: hypothetical protein [Caudoviricetes sp.]